MDSHHTDKDMLFNKFQKDAVVSNPSHTSWAPQGSDTDLVLPNGVEEFSQGGMAREGLEEGSASPGQHSPEHQHDRFSLSSSDAGFAQVSHNAPQTPSSGHGQEGRRRRKPGLEDIVRRRRSELETNPFTPPADFCEDQSPEAFAEDHEGEQPLKRRRVEEEQGENEFDSTLSENTEQPQPLPLPIEDEVDGSAPLTREDISRQMMNAQACAESAIKQSMQRAGFARIDNDDDDDENADDSLNPYANHPAAAYLRHGRPEDLDDEEEIIEDDDSGSEFNRSGSTGPWQDMERNLDDSLARVEEDRARRERREGGDDNGEERERKAEVTILPKTSHIPPGGLPHRSHPHNPSENAFSPHHLNSKMNGWFPPGMPHLFPPFGPGGLMDGPPGLGPKFMPFPDGKVNTFICLFLSSSI
jgi:hypothetical protein